MIEEVGNVATTTTAPFTCNYNPECLLRCSANRPRDFSKAQLQPKLPARLKILWPTWEPAYHWKQKLKSFQDKWVSWYDSLNIWHWICSFDNDSGRSNNHEPAFNIKSRSSNNSTTPTTVQYQCSDWGHPGRNKQTPFRFVVPKKRSLPLEDWAGDDRAYCENPACRHWEVPCQRNSSPRRLHLETTREAIHWIC